MEKKIGGFLVSRFALWASELNSVSIFIKENCNYSFIHSFIHISLRHNRTTNNINMMFIFISCSISCFLEATKRIRKGKFICLHAFFRLLIIYFRWPPPQSANTANVIIVSKLICFSIGPRGSCAVRHVTISSLPDDIIVFVVIGLGGPI